MYVYTYIVPIFLKITWGYSMISLSFMLLGSTRYQKVFFRMSFKNSKEKIMYQLIKILYFTAE